MISRKALSSVVVVGSSGDNRKRTIFLCCRLCSPRNFGQRLTRAGLLSCEDSGKRTEHRLDIKDEESLARYQVPQSTDSILKMKIILRDTRYQRGNQR